MIYKVTLGNGPSKRFSNTYSYSYITKFATSVTHLCPKASRIEFLPVALSNSKVPRNELHFEVRTRMVR